MFRVITMTIVYVWRVYVLASDANDRKRKKKSRWGGSDLEKTFIPGMPTVLPHNLTKEQEEAYIRKLIISFHRWIIYYNKNVKCHKRYFVNVCMTSN